MTTIAKTTSYDGSQPTTITCTLDHATNCRNIARGIVKAHGGNCKKALEAHMVNEALYCNYENVRYQLKQSEVENKKYFKELKRERKQAKQDLPAMTEPKEIASPLNQDSEACASTPRVRFKDELTSDQEEIKKIPKASLKEDESAHIKPEIKPKQTSSESYLEGHSIKTAAMEEKSFFSAIWSKILYLFPMLP